MTHARRDDRDGEALLASGLDRRQALMVGGLATLGLAGVAAGQGAGAPARPEAGRPAAADAVPGWDASKGEYVLAPLPYAFDALEPHIDAKTMEIHHGKHHAGYVTGLNKALGELKTLRGNADAPTLEYWTNKVSFNAGGHLNHTLFWTGMASPSDGGGGEPTGPLKSAIERDFGSFANFKMQFTSAAKSVEGAGWAWLVEDPVARRLMVLQMHNQQKSVFAGAKPLLGVDVWEHAYYLKYQNRRPEYIEAWWNVVNWPEIGRRFGMG